MPDFLQIGPQLQFAADLQADRYVSFEIINVPYFSSPVECFYTSAIEYQRYAFNIIS